MPQLPDEIDLTALLDRNAFKGGTKIIVSETMRIVHTDDGLDLQPAWLAEVCERPNMRRALIRIVDDNPRALFEQLAALSEAGEVHITHGDGHEA